LDFETNTFESIQKFELDNLPEFLIYVLGVLLLQPEIVFVFVLLCLLNKKKEIEKERKK